MKIFLLEDEALAAMEIAAILSEAGHEILGPAETLSDGARLLSEETPDFAIVDANIHGEAPLGIVEDLIRRGVPYVYVSGYPEAEVKRALPDGPFVPKPMLYDKLLQVMPEEN